MGESWLETVENDDDGIGELFAILGSEGLEEDKWIAELDVNIKAQDVTDVEVVANKIVEKLSEIGEIDEF